MNPVELPIWPYAYGGPSGTGRIKTEPDDFVVEEQLSFEPQGSGEHVFLHIEKVGENTEYVARLLARFAGVRQRDIGYAGLKDRHARTRQWFSVWLPGKVEPDWMAFNSDTVTVLEHVRHARKLQRGVLAGNRFQLLIRDWQGDQTHCLQQVQQIAEHGFPNYFGEQRFGRDGANLQQAQALFDGANIKREQRGMLLSAARSYLFNHILAARVSNQTWRQIVAGDLMQLTGSHSHFVAEQLDDALQVRLTTGDIQPTGWLPGLGKPEPLLTEQALVAAFPQWLEGLGKNEVYSARRALRVKPIELSVVFPNSHELQLSFGLPAGSYATALLRELLNWQGERIGED